jgi:protein-S-isoprenylcysteine O-methyltransferase Ste14
MTYFEGFVWAWIAMAIVAFAYLLIKPAPYGRHLASGWGFVLKNKHAWILMELPVFLIVGFYGLQVSGGEWTNLLLIALFLAHYLNRCLIYPFRLKSTQRKMPLTIVLSAILFNLVNGNLLGYSLTQLGSIQARSTFWLGIGVFIAGMIINVLSDETLFQIRKKSEHYTIPRGGFYTYVSCPNYLGEMLEWLGFAIAGGNLGVWSFFIWTCANLIPRAISHHRWNQTNIPGYPKERKALLPYLL